MTATTVTLMGAVAGFGAGPWRGRSDRVRRSAPSLWVKVDRLDPILLDD